MIQILCQMKKAFLLYSPFFYILSLLLIIADAYLSSTENSTKLQKFFFINPKRVFSNHDSDFFTLSSEGTTKRDESVNEEFLTSTGLNDKIKKKSVVKKQLSISEMNPDSFKQAKDQNNDRLSFQRTQNTDRNDRVKKNSVVKKLLSISEVNPDNFKQSEDKNNEWLSFQRMQNFPHKVNYFFRKDPGKLDLYMHPYNPVFHRRNRNSYLNYRRNVFHPHIYLSNYGFTNFRKPFSDIRDPFGDFSQGYRQSSSEKRLVPSSLSRDNPFLKNPTGPPIPFTSNVPNAIQNYSRHFYFSTNEIKAANDLMNKTKNDSGGEQADFQEIHQNSSDVPDDVYQEFSKGNTGDVTSKNSRIQWLPQTNEEYFSLDMNGLKSNPIVWDERSYPLEEPNEIQSIQNIQERDISTSDDPKIDSLLASNRVYFEKIPANTNQSWFIYVNCTRDICQFTNTTNATELLSNGWILHNCTTYGCIEMYPKTKSNQKFIGLMLLVFSFCVLKITALLLLYYYCLNGKLSKNSSEARNPSSWDEEKFDFLSSEKKEQRSNQENRKASKWKNRFKHIFKHENPMDDDIPTGLGEKSLFVDEDAPEYVQQNLLLSPVRIFSPCLTSSSKTKNIEIPKKQFNKVQTNHKNSYSARKKYRSNIPRLQRRSKCSEKESAESNANTAGEKSTDSDKTLTAGGDGEVNLMSFNNTDSEKNKQNLESRTSIEGKSFVSIKPW